MKKALILLVLTFAFYNFTFVKGQTTTPMLTLNTPMHTAKISRISTDKNGKYILTCSDDKTAKLWNAATGGLIKTFRPPIDEGNEGMLYAGAIFANRKYGIIVGLILLMLYAYFYTLLQLQLYSLLFGSIGMAVMLSVIMLLTRNLHRERETESIEEE